MERKEMKAELDRCEKLLIGIGEEWQAGQVPDILEVYDLLAERIQEKDYFIVTTNTDAEILKSSLHPSCITAPCGNETWRQCSKSCTKDIWEPMEIPEDICPHCGAPLTGNTRKAEVYIEEGYLPQWKRYTEWLARTLNKDLLILELGVGFAAPTVIRWPFEKTVLVNKKARMYRVNQSLPQITKELEERAVSVTENSVEFIRKL